MIVLLSDMSFSIYAVMCVLFYRYSFSFLRNQVQKNYIKNSLRAAYKKSDVIEQNYIQIHVGPRIRVSCVPGRKNRTSSRLRQEDIFSPVG